MSDTTRKGLHDLSYKYIKSQFKPPVSRYNGWWRVPEELGEAIYMVAFMIGLETICPEGRLKAMYTKSASVPHLEDGVFLTYADEEGWEVREELLPKFCSILEGKD